MEHEDFVKVIGIDIAERLTPFLDRDTVSRFTVEDFALTDEERASMRDVNVRASLEAVLREVVNFEVVAAQALFLWRSREARR